MAHRLFAAKTPDLNNLFGVLQQSGHEMVVAVSDSSVGLKGYIGIHSTKLGPALGGTRVQTYSSDQDALDDVLNLSRAMTYKCALAGLPYGGGKGVISFDPSCSKQDILAAYARIVENLRGLFKTGTDVGISDDEVKYMGSFTTHMLGLTDEDRGSLSTSNCAALGVFFAIKAAMQIQHNSEELAGKRIAIKGVGKLGCELARLLSEAGAHVIAADMNPENLRKLQTLIPNAKIVDTSDIHKQEVDLYAPCALGNEFYPKTVKQLRCSAVVGGANNQLSDPSIGQQMHDRGILYAPDYVANGGGLIYVADELEAGGFSQDRVLQRVENIQNTMTDIFERSVTEKLPTSFIADKIAEERLLHA